MREKEKFLEWIGNMWIINIKPYNSKALELKQRFDCEASDKVNWFEIFFWKNIRFRFGWNIWAVGINSLK
jgi:hypothetical protein